MKRKDDPDLLSGNLREKERVPKRLIGLSICAAIVLTILIISTVYFEGIKSSYLTQTKAKKDNFADVMKKSRVIQRTKNIRAQYFKKAFFAQYPLKYSYTVSNFLRKISLLTSDEIGLTDFWARPSSLKIKFGLKASIFGETNRNVLTEFLAFFKKLENFDNMLNISFTKVREGSGGLNDGIINNKDQQKSELDKEETLFFSITGEIDLE